MAIQSPAVQTPEEAEYIKKLLHEEQQQPNDLNPSVITQIILYMMGVMLYPLKYLLISIAKRREVAAWSRESDKEVYTPIRNDIIRHQHDDSIKKWTLHCHNGRQVWTHDPNKQTQTYIERVHTHGSNNCTTRATNVEEALQHAIKHISKLQSDDGHWSNDYGGPLFLLPGLVITVYIINDCDPNKIFTAAHRYVLFFKKQTTPPLQPIPKQVTKTD